MRCTGCGEANEPDDAFCRWCGLPLTTEDPETTDPAPPDTGGPARRRTRTRRPGRWRRWLIGAVAVVAVLALLAAAVWWFVFRPAGTAQSIPDTVGMVPAQPAAPSVQWTLPASEVSTSCRVPGADTTNTSGRRCELTVVDWPDGQLVGTVSKGSADSMRVSDLFGVNPGDGRPTWKLPGMSAVCTTPRFDSRLACADTAASTVFALDPATGEQLWSVPFKEPVVDIATAGEEVYLYTDGDAGPTVSRVTARGSVAWTRTAPDGVRLVEDDPKHGIPPQPDRLTVLYDGVLHLGALQNREGEVWAVNRRTGDTVETSGSVLAVAREHSSGDLVPVIRHTDGAISAGETEATGVAGEDDRPGLFLPYAEDDGADVPWLFIEDTHVPRAFVHAIPVGRDANGDALAAYWYMDEERPMAICAGRKAVYDTTNHLVSYSPLESENWEKTPTTETVGFACDGSRIIAVDRTRIAAQDADGPVWEVPLDDATGLQTSSRGLLISTDGGTSVSLYR